MTQITFTDIPVSEINLSDTGFRITACLSDIGPLTASIAEYGIITAPLVMCKKDQYILVSGFRRTQAALAAGLSNISCRVMPKEAGLEAAIAAVSENSFSRPLTSSELIRATALLSGVMDAQSIADNATAILNMPLNPGYIQTLLRIHAMPEPVLDLLDQGQLSIKACKRLGSMDKKSIVVFLDLFSKIKVSSGIQMEIIAWANEICALEKITLEQLIRQSPIGAPNKIEEPGQGKPPGHKDMGALGKRFKAFLAQRRFPVLTKAKARAKEQVNALDLDKGLQLAIPENFEGIVYTMQMQFKNVDEFKTRLRRLAEVAKLDHFQSLVDGDS